MINKRPLIKIETIYQEFSEYIELLNIIKTNFKVDFYGIHGIYHWFYVYKNTQKLTDYYNINSSVPKLFSILHDSKRVSELRDINHGPRAANFIKELYVNDILNINENDFERLIFACSNHTKLDKSNPLADDIIVQICLDSDKLDITRVGKIVDSDYLFTPYAKELALQ